MPSAPGLPTVVRTFRVLGNMLKPHRSVKSFHCQEVLILRPFPNEVVSLHQSTSPAVERRRVEQLVKGDEGLLLYLHPPPEQHLLAST